MEIRFKNRFITTTLYAVPTFSYKGWITAWWGQDSKWKKGFVVRFLWLGFVLRWAKAKPKRRNQYGFIPDEADTF